MPAAARTFYAGLLSWYDRHQRVLPWRSVNPVAYHVLVSEFMLQQTQVTTVIPYFHRFLERFPTLEDLAAAPQQDVLCLWQGLGYYSRARNLHAAAGKITADHHGQIPHDLPSLLNLPGIGRYTAGAIASIAFDQRAPILDGNVARVICRLDLIQADPRDPSITRRLWMRAEEILPPGRIGDFNSALMELGATVCTPRNPRCPICPLRRICRARASGLQDQIPLPRKAKPTPLVRRHTFAVSHRGRWLIEQRPPRGRWANMWQFITVTDDCSKPDSTVAGALLGFQVRHLRKLGIVSHALTHRRYRFTAYACNTCNKNALPAVSPRKWVNLKQLARYPLSKPQLKIAQMLIDP